MLQCIFSVAVCLSVTLGLSVALYSQSCHLALFQRHVVPPSVFTHFIPLAVVCAFSGCSFYGQVFSNSQWSAHCVCSLAVVLLCGQQSVQFLVGVELCSPSLPSLYTSGQFGVVIVLHVCSHVGSLFLFASCFLSFLFFNGFHYYYFDWLPLMFFSVTSADVLCCLYFIWLSVIGAGACGWVVDTAGHGSGSILQGLRCWPTTELFQALHL